MSAVKDLFDQIMKAIDKKTKKAGTNYTGKVTRVEGDTAYVQFDGSAINDTPVKMSIDAKPGDSVRIMVQGGKAWLTGNDTAPPTNDTVVINEIKEESSHIKETTNQVTLAVGTKMDSDMGNRKSSIVVDSGKIEFKSNTLVIDSDNFKLEEDGDATFSGTLSAAGGTFAGELDFNWTKGENPQELILADQEGAPLRIAEYMQQSGRQVLTSFVSMNAQEILLRKMRPNLGEYVSITAPLITVHQNMGTATIDYTGVHTSSDERLKADVSDLDADKAKKLRPVRFHFKNEKDWHYGFIAQEVQEVLPEAVKPFEDGYLSLNYQELIAPLYALVQEQEERIKQLEDRIDMLSRRMDDGK